MLQSTVVKSLAYLTSMLDFKQTCFKSSRINREYRFSNAASAIPRCNLSYCRMFFRQKCKRCKADFASWGPSFSCPQSVQSGSFGQASIELRNFDQHDSGCSHWIFVARQHRTSNCINWRQAMTVHAEFLWDPIPFAISSSAMCMSNESACMKTWSNWFHCFWSNKPTHHKMNDRFLLNPVHKRKYRSQRLCLDGKIPERAVHQV